MPKPHLIVVADASFARIYEQPRYASTPSLVKELDNPDGRRRSQELVSARSGYKGNQARGWPQAVAPSADPTAIEEERFSRELADIVTALVDEGAYATISLFTAPSMLGHLRKVLPRRVHERVVQEEPCDLKNLPDARLAEKLRSMVPPRPVGEARWRSP